MCGGRDYAPDAYLYRFCLPGVSVGNPYRVYILGKRGLEFLQSDGLSVGWYFRPAKVRRLGYSQMIHKVSLTRFLVAARRWAESAKGVRLCEARICYELGAVSVEMEEKGRKEKVAVVPDGWLYFEKSGRGKKPEWFPVLVEIDRGTMFRERLIWGKVDPAISLGTTSALLMASILVSLLRSRIRPASSG